MTIIETNPQRTREEILEHVNICCHALEDKKVADLTVLDMRETLAITDYFLIATGTSEPHLRALFKEMDQILTGLEYEIPSKCKDYYSGWVVVDAIDFVIHLFSKEKRKYYSLEQLWKDAPEINPG